MERQNGIVTAWFTDRWVMGPGDDMQERVPDIELTESAANAFVIEFLRGPIGPQGPMGAQGVAGTFEPHTHPHRHDVDA